jgi:hypothetical protein
MGKSKGKMKKMSRQQQKAVGASMAESGINMNAQQVVAQPAQQIVQQPVQQMTNVPPAPSNTLGQAQPVFNQQTQQNAQGIFGGVDQRQNSVGASALFQTNQLGNTQDEQAKLNSAENSKQVKFAKEFNNYKAAIEDKKNWEKTENDFGFGDKEYPQQRQLDSLRTVYRNKQL